MEITRQDPEEVRGVGRRPKQGIFTLDQVGTGPLPRYGLDSSNPFPLLEVFDGTAEVSRP